MLKNNSKHLMFNFNYKTAQKYVGNAGDASDYLVVLLIQEVKLTLWIFLLVLALPLLYKSFIYFCHFFIEENSF